MAVLTFAEADHDLVEIMKARCEQSCAERDAALDALACVLAHFPELGAMFSSHEQQRALADARALLVESGR